MNQKKSLKYLICGLSIIFLLLVTVNPLQAKQKFVISSCDVLIELITDYQRQLRDVWVTMQITYDILHGSKVEDFKLLGTLPISNISVLDFKKRPISFNVEKKHKSREKQHKISWKFYGTPKTKKTIILGFVLKGALMGDLEENWLKFDWLNEWNYPVFDITYRFVLPKKHKFEITHSKPAAGKIFKYQDRREFEMYVENLASRDFEIRFSPGFTEGAVAQPGDPVKGGIGFFTIVLFVVLGLAAGWFLFKLDVFSSGGDRSIRLMRWRRRM